MARAPTTSDVFNAIAEPRRREILELFAQAEWSVQDVVERLGMDQPAVSKHLRVLREVDLVNVRRDGRRRLYSAKRERLDPVRDWIEKLERLWDHQLDRIQARAESRARRDR